MLYINKMSDYEESDGELDKDIEQEEEEVSKVAKPVKTTKKSTTTIEKNTEELEQDSDIESLLSDEEDELDELEEEGEEEEEDEIYNESKSLDLPKNLQEEDSGKPIISPINSDVESDDDEEEYKKFDEEINFNFVKKNHPESLTANAIEIEKLCVIKRNGNQEIDDELHRTLPILTKYEKTRILGQRAKQLNNGSKSLISVPADVLDGYLIAQLELEKKVLPFIIRRPLPNGTSEYWKLNDLEII